MGFYFIYVYVCVYAKIFAYLSAHIAKYLRVAKADGMPREEERRKRTKGGKQHKWHN